VALAVGSQTRSSVLPDVPTTEEAGYKGSAYNFWIGMFAPAGTPPALIDRSTRRLPAALASPEVKDRLGALGADASPTSPSDLDKTVARGAQRTPYGGLRHQISRSQRSSHAHDVLWL